MFTMNGFHIFTRQISKMFNLANRNTLRTLTLTIVINLESSFLHCIFFFFLVCYVKLMQQFARISQQIANGN